jgi:tRNA(fMet)-specific endonuclease VapC
VASYLLDTGILVGYVRGAGYAAYVEKKYQVSQPPNLSLISIVSKGEILSLGMQFGWGTAKMASLEQLLRRFPFVDINQQQIIERYADIDAYSQAKHPTRKASMSPRNMGKNDLWIAATASVLNATLLTTDHHFDHLNGVFLEVLYIDQSLKAADA